jgi:hypothetical protein
MIDTTRNITQAYIALANKTLQQEDNVEVFDSLEDIATHLKSSNPLPGQDVNTKVHVKIKKLLLPNFTNTILKKYKLTTL